MGNCEKEDEETLGGLPMVEMVRKAQDQLLHYPKRSAGSEVKRMIRQLLGQKGSTERPL